MLIFQNTGSLFCRGPKGNGVQSHAINLEDDPAPIIGMDQKAGSESWVGTDQNVGMSSDWEERVANLYMGRELTLKPANLLHSQL